MPKYGQNFDDLLQITCNSELKLHLAAIAFYQNLKGEYSPVARNFLARAVEDFYLDLDPKGQKKYDMLLESVKAQEEVRKQRKEERIRAKQREESRLTERMIRY